MKSGQILSGFLFASALMLFSCGKDSKSDTDQLTGDCLTFETTTIDYGTITKGANPDRTIEIKNESPDPVVILNAQSSCGCLVPTYPASPILPGESADFKVRYDTQRVGAFSKTVTVQLNCSDEYVTITVKGTVIE